MYPTKACGRQRLFVQDRGDALLFVVFVAPDEFIRQTKRRFRGISFFLGKGTQGARRGKSMVYPRPI